MGSTYMNLRKNSNFLLAGHSAKEILVYFRCQGNKGCLLTKLCCPFPWPSGEMDGLFQNPTDLFAILKLQIRSTTFLSYYIKLADILISRR